MLLAGCASLQAMLAVDVKAPLAECRKLDPRVAGPGSLIGPNTDYRVLSAEALVALRKANEGTDRRNTCEDHVVERYAGEKP
jgi:hypothetical protein